MSSAEQRAEVVRYWWEKAEFYDRLFEDRQEGDYLALVEFERDYVAGQLVECREFLSCLRPLVSTLAETT